MNWSHEITRADLRVSGVLAKSALHRDLFRLDVVKVSRYHPNGAQGRDRFTLLTKGKWRIAGGSTFIIGYRETVTPGYRRPAPGY